MNNLRQLRKSQHLTMKELGKIVGMSESTISLYERGLHEPDIETMGKIADVLHTTVDELIGRDDLDTKKEPATPGGLNARFADRVTRLSPENLARFDAYLDGLLAAQDKQEP